MLDNAVKQIRNITDFVPDIAIILGSGLGGFADKINKVCEIPFDDIDNMLSSTAPSHEGKFIFGNIDDKNVVIMQGRIHLYEGCTPQEAVFPVRIMRRLGAEKLIITNAVGGINKNLNVGDFMLITDHIASFVPSPLIGQNDDTLGVRYPDMSNAYDKALQKTAKEVASSLNITLKTGVFAQLIGPQFETPAEIRMLSSLGADTVGMSTAIETVAAVHCGFKVCGVSLITNLACGILDKPLTSEEVNDTGSRVAPDFERLIKGIVKAL